MFSPRVSHRSGEKTKERGMEIEKPEEPKKKNEVDITEFAVEEFAIVELEDRLEMCGRCNVNCNCSSGCGP